MNRLLPILPLVLGLAQAGVDLSVYRDPERRFSFSYPAAFGTVTRGTNDGFGYRAAAMRFTDLPPGLGGEVVLTRGFPLVDVQAVGGLYDAFTLEALPDAVRDVVLATLTRLTAASFCREAAREEHLDLEREPFAALPPQQKQAIRSLDRMRGVSPVLLRCESEGDTVTFHKVARFQHGGPPQDVFGAIRFLDGTYSSFQFIRGGAAPSPGDLEAMAALVRSWNLSK